MHISIDDHNDATPLIDVQINIDKSLQECRKIKEQRMTELNRLQEEVILTFYFIRPYFILVIYIYICLLLKGKTNLSIT